MDIAMDHASFAVTDIDQAIAFLSEAFGFRVTFVERGMTGQIASMLGMPQARCDLAQLAVGDGPVKIEVIKFEPGAELGQPSRPIARGMGHLALRLGGFDAALARTRDLGAQLLGEITQFSDGRAAYLGTPFGLFLELQDNAEAA